MKVYSTPLSGWDVSNGDLTRDWNEQNSIEVGWVRSNDIASNDTTSDTTSSWNEPNGTSSADWSESNYALSTSWKWSNDGTNNERKPNGTFSGWDAPGSMVPGWNESDNTVSGWGEASHITVGWGDANNGTFKWGEMNTAIVEEETSHRHHSSWGKVQEGRSNWDASPCSIQKKEISSSQTNYGNVDYFASVHDPPPIGKSKSDLGSPPPIDTSIAWTQLADSGPKSPDSMFLSPIASPRHMQTLEKLFPQFLELVSKVVETGSEASIKDSALFLCQDLGDPVLEELFFEGSLRSIEEKGLTRQHVDPFYDKLHLLYLINEILVTQVGFFGDALSFNLTERCRSLSITAKRIFHIAFDEASSNPDAKLLLVKQLRYFDPHFLESLFELDEDHFKEDLIQKTKQRSFLPQRDIPALQDDLFD